MFRRATSIAALALLAASNPTWAEPITILGGNIFYSRANQARFVLDLEGGLRLQGDYGNSAGEFWNPPYACGPCAPGASINMSVTESFPAAGATVGGVLNFGGIPFDLTSAGFAINAGNVTLGDPVDAAPSTRTPFSMTASVSGEAFNGAVRGTFDFAGSGSSFITTEGGRWFSSTYEFESAAPVVPEPATLLLLGGAAAAAFGVRKKKRA
jgi:hypothetical protein